MKKLILGAVLVVSCWAQQPSLSVTTTPQPASITTVTVTGVQGSTQYCYWVVAIYALGKSAPAGPVCTFVANAALSVANYDIVNWLAPTTPLATVTGYDVLRTTSLTPPTGACACAVATNVANSPQNDQANALNAYTVATATTTGQVYLPNLTGGLTSMLFCGATTGNANCGNINPVNTAKSYGGVATLAANSAIITFNATNGGFTSTATYTCVANDVTTRANPVQMVPTTATTATITNTTGATDAINWMCIGY